MATIPWSEIRKNLTPDQIARSDSKAEKLRIGIFIAERRKESGLTQQELADNLGITQQAISKMEWGEEIQFSTLRKVLSVLGGELYVHLPDREISLTHLVAD